MSNNSTTSIIPLTHSIPVSSSRQVCDFRGSVSSATPPLLKKAICILSRYYNESWITFLKTFKNYDVFMIIDDVGNINNIEINIIDNINIVKIPDAECKNSNYYNSSVASNLKQIVTWDRALYFFNKILSSSTPPLLQTLSSNTPEFSGSASSSTPPLLQTRKYDYIWFLEDDIFVFNEKVLINIDEKYPSSDLLSAFNEINEKGDINHGWNHWINVIHRIGTPWAHSLISASRLSSKLLDRIDEYVKDRPLLFIEALFNTLALHNNYKVDNPVELCDTITYDKKWDIDNVDIIKIYHPFKNIEDHEYIRKKYS